MEEYWDVLCGIGLGLMIASVPFPILGLCKILSFSQWLPWWLGFMIVGNGVFYVSLHKQR